jgi:hypothetical protein
MNPTDLISVIAAITGAVAAIFSGVSVGVTQAQTRSNIQMTCMTTFAGIQSKRLNIHDTIDAQNYYRELMDLEWSEYYARSIGSIDKVAFEKWVESWHDLYNKDAIVVHDTVNRNPPLTIINHTVSYRTEWDKWRSYGYFHNKDSFVGFMENIFKKDDSEIIPYVKHYHFWWHRNHITRIPGS